MTSRDFLSFDLHLQPRGGSRWMASSSQPVVQVEKARDLTSNTILFLDYPSRDPRLVSGFQVVNSFRRRSGDRIARWEVVFGFSNPGNRLIKVTVDKAFAASICCVSRSNFAVMANVVARVGRSVFFRLVIPPNCYPSMQPRIQCLLARGLSEVCQFHRTIPFPLEVFKLSSLKFLSLRCWREISFVYFKFRFIRNVR
jgi:hypothetical protein